MIRRVTAGICCAVALAAGAMQWEDAPAQPAVPAVRPILYVFSASYCGPCHVFDAAFQDDPQFARQLQVYDMRRVDVQRSDLRHLVKRFAIETVPTFLIADPRTGFCVRKPDGSFRRHVGFDTTNVEQAKRDLLSGLGVSVSAQPQQELPQTAPAGQPQGSGNVDPMLRRQIEGLTQTIDQINERLAAQLSDNAELRGALQRERQKNGSTERAELEAERKQLQEQREKLQRELQAAIDAQKAAAAAASAAKDQQPHDKPTEAPATDKANLPPVTDAPLWDRDKHQRPDPQPSHASPDTPSEPAAEPNVQAEQQSSELWRQWAKVGRGALMLAAPEFAIPGSLALAVGGFAVSQWRSRRKGRAARRAADTFHQIQQQRVAAQPEPEAIPPPAPGSRPVPREYSEALEVMRLAQREGRIPIHEAIRGTMADDELRQLAEDPDPQRSRLALELIDKINRRFSEVAPISQRPDAFA